MPYTTGNASQIFDFDVIGELLATGDGVQLVFNFTIDEEKGQIDNFVGNYTIGVTPHTFTTDEDGNITGTDLTGTFDGKDGTLTFTSEPTGPITGDYTSQGVISQVVDFATDRKTKTQVIGTGDGVQTVFPIALANVPVAPGQTLLKVPIGGTVYHIYPQSGVFDHPLITGTLNETTGVGSIATTSPVDNTEDIEAVYSDSATPGQDWIKLREETTRDGSGNEEYPGEKLKQVWLKNSGFSGKVANNEGGIVIGIRECKSTSINAFGFQGNIWKTFSDANLVNASFLSNSLDIGGSFNSNGSMNNMPTCNTAETSLVWFCSATKNHIFICVLSLGTIYSQLAIGCGNPESSFLLYLKPYFCKGNSATLKSLSDAANGFFGPHTGNTAETKYIRPDGTFNTGTSGYDLLPRDTYSTSAPKKNTKNNKVVIRPVEIHDTVANQTYFEIPGLFFCPSNQLSPQDVLNDDSVPVRAYDVFIEHNSVDEADFFCVDKDL